MNAIIYIAFANWKIIVALDKAFNIARNKVAALSLVTFVAFSGSVSANDNIIPKTNYQPTNLVTDVDESLRSWAKNNPGGVAVGVKLSEKFPKSPEYVVERLTSAMGEVCPTANTIVMIEIDDLPGAVFSLRYDQKVDRNIKPGEIGKKAKDAAQHICTEQEIFR